MDITAQNTDISPDLLVWKFCGKTISVEFRSIFPKLCGNCAFPQNFHTRKLGAILVFYAVHCKILQFNFGKKIS